MEMVYSKDKKIVSSLVPFPFTVYSRSLPFPFTCSNPLHSFPFSLHVHREGEETGEFRRVLYCSQTRSDHREKANLG